MTAADHVLSITLLSDRNPRPIMATFHLGPKAGRPEVVTRVRLNGSQQVRALAHLSDGSYWSASARGGSDGVGVPGRRLETNLRRRQW